MVSPEYHKDMRESTYNQNFAMKGSGNKEVVISTATKVSSNVMVGNLELVDELNGNNVNVVLEMADPEDHVISMEKVHQSQTPPRVGVHSKISHNTRWKRRVRGFA